MRVVSFEKSIFTFILQMTFSDCFFRFTYCHVFWGVQGPEKGGGEGGIL